MLGVNTHNTHQLVDRYNHQFLDMFDHFHSHSNHNDMFHRRYSQQMNSYQATVAEHKEAVEAELEEAEDLAAVAAAEEEALALQELLH